MNVIKRKLRAGLFAVAATVIGVAANTAAAAPFAAFVMDGRTGQQIHAQNADTPLHPASLTKMMTLYLAFAAVEQGQVRLDSRFTVSEHAASQPPSKLGLRPGQKIELRYLIRAAAVKSCNDAAMVIAEGLAGSEARFAGQMTATARALGMNRTQFRNPHGLTSEGHYSTARDMTVLGRHLFYDFPQYYNIFSRRSADAGIATVSSTNARFLDNYQGADGIKTGYTRAAGFNLTASAQRGSKRVMATVMGGTSTAQRNQIMAELLDAGFSRAPARVAEVRPQPVLVKPQVVRRASVAAPVPAPQTRPVVMASASTAAPALDLSQALREAMAARPLPAPVRSAPTPVAFTRDDAVYSALAESLRPSARPEGSAPEGNSASLVRLAPGASRPPRQAGD